jgi:hypothetical protein
MDKELHKMAQR